VIGEVLGSYRVVSRLGAGGMGTVYLGEHQLLGSRAAIKVLLPEMSEQKRIVERFFDEARAATRIQDPGIVTVHEIGWHGTSAYIVMEHLNGETLTSRLARYGNLPLVMALRLLQHCALAMAAAHARGIVHRDLKPDNIFVVSDPVVAGGERTKILDFGIAKLIDDADASHSRTQTGMIMGTPAYMSPEQCRGAGSVDHRTDVYALGCVMFAMLVGHPPFIAPTAGDLIVSHLREEPAVPSSLRSEIPPALDELVLRCLSKLPDARYQSMTELVRACAQITGENLSIPTIPPLIAQTPRPSAETLATTPPAAVNTTLLGATGETLGHARPWRGGMLVVIFVALMIGAVAFIATRKRASPARAPSTDSAAPPPSIDAAPLATTPDAAPSIVIAPDAGAATTTRPRPRPRPGSGSVKSGSGSATTKSGSGSSYDPYKER
jgi:serine/threonine protein kinase